MTRNRPATALERIGFASFNVKLHIGGRNAVECLVERNCLHFAGPGWRYAGARGGEILVLRLERNDVGKMITSGAAKFGNGIALVSPAVDEDLVPVHLEKVFR